MQLDKKGHAEYNGNAWIGEDGGKAKCCCVIILGNKRRDITKDTTALLYPSP